MRPWRLLAHDGVSASWGLAVDEALMAGYGRGLPPRPPTIRLYTYASHCALVGRYQHTEAEVDLEACRRSGTEVSRRPTGGGAIVMGAGQLGVAVVDRARAERPRETLQRFARGVVAGLAEAGVEARFSGKNDLEVGGRKIAGLGLYLDGGGAVLFHASILADLDVGHMLQVLRVPAAKLGDKGVEAVEARVTTVTRETGRRWTGAELREPVAAGFEKAMGVRLEPDELTATEREAAAALERRYRSPEWIHQRSPRPEARGSAAFKTPAGLVRVFVAVEGDVFTHVLFCGDFNVLPPALVALEASLRWARADPDRLQDLAAGAAEALEVPAATVAGAILEAAGRASAAPLRHGSCYFPEPEGVGGR